MRHLIIGAGVMGKKHGSILQSLGDKVRYADLGFNPKGYNFGGLDSILICTPPHLHVNYVLELGKLGIPLFIEKPYSDARVFWDPPGTSMVACNWRFCGCGIEDRSVISFGYKARDVYPVLDLIHFVDLIWERHGRPVYADIRDNMACFLLRMGYEDGLMSTRLIDCAFSYTADPPYMYFGPEKIHEHQVCNMFIKQMNHWRDCVKNGRESVNPISKARERTNWLIDLCCDAGLI